MHRGDAFLYDSFAEQAVMFGWTVMGTLPVERWIEHGDRIELGKWSLAQYAESTVRSSQRR